MSTVEVCRRGGVPCEARSVGDAVHEMGSCCKTWVLRQEQMEWRSSAEPYVYLTGNGPHSEPRFPTQSF